MKLVRHDVQLSDCDEDTYSSNEDDDAFDSRNMSRFNDTRVGGQNPVKGILGRRIREGRVAESNDGNLKLMGLGVRASADYTPTAATPGDTEFYLEADPDLYS